MITGSAEEKDMTMLTSVQWMYLLKPLVVSREGDEAGARKCHTCEAGLAGRCHTKNVVYKIKCNMCDDNTSIYIGETKRRVRERFNEQLRDAKNKIEDTSLGDHASKVHPRAQ